jgi:hypothetical protein
MNTRIAATPHRARNAARALPPILLALLLVPFAFGPAVAQDDDADFPGRKRVEEWRKIKLIEAVELSEEQSLRFFAREREFRAGERKLGEERAAATNRLRALAGGNPDDAEVQKELAALADIHHRMVQQRSDFVLGLRDLLSMKQIAKLIAFEDDFSRELRELLHRSGGKQRWRR